MFVYVVFFILDSGPGEIVFHKSSLSKESKSDSRFIGLWL